MKFFHVYNEKCFIGLEKNGFLNKDSGFKIQNCFPMDPELKFNRFAAKGTKLHGMIKEGTIPFYVDRLAGGIAWHDYRFDPELTEEYANILGDWFLGFQLHESGSNRRISDWAHLRELGGGDGPYDLETLKKNMVSLYAKMPDGTPLYQLSQDGPEFYKDQRYAYTPADFQAEMADMFRRRMAENAGRILPVDSYYMATKLQDDMGMRTFMPEVGCQIPLMRIQVAMARGIARKSRKTWGTYYECWRFDEESGYTMPCFNDDPINEWYLPQDQHPDDFSSYGQNGGSSRLLQARIYYYTVMSGADYFGEEWGLNCSYTDMQTFDLSDYGKVKKSFIRAAEKLQGIKAVTPFAIVLPNTYSVVELPDPYNARSKAIREGGKYLECELSDAEFAHYGHLDRVLDLFFGRNDPDTGNEGHVMTNSRFGDLFDIIYEDAPKDTLARYAALIDASHEGNFKKANADLNVLASDDLEALAAQIEALTEQVMPCTADCLHWLVSEDGEGKRYLSIFNNEGNHRTFTKGDTIDHSKDAWVTIKRKDSAAMEIVHGSESVSLQKVDEDTYKAFVPATGLLVVRF
ncbi:MAG: hypothetical protein IJO88_08485 [Oscillospiraceae bacterium]|nr:hypothetical protein [Oscillospiraceae bacterium]